MIPSRVKWYLGRYAVRYEVLEHPVAITAQELAQSLSVSGHQVAKSVLVRIDGERCLVVLPAVAQVDTAKLAQQLGAHSAEIATEEEMAECFPDCEVGAEPPFGRLYSVPVIVAEELERATHIIFNAGTHREAIRMSFAAFDMLENPRIASFEQPAHA